MNDAAGALLVPSVGRRKPISDARSTLVFGCARWFIAFFIDVERLRSAYLAYFHSVQRIGVSGFPGFFPSISSDLLVSL